MTTSSSRGAGPLTDRVRDELVRRIRVGELAPGEQLPAERELCDEFGVSRVTVRRALGALGEAGVVQAIQGRGTFVSSPRLAEPPNTLQSFHELVAGGRVSVGAEPLHVGTRPATLDEAELFGIAPGAALFELVRLRTLDELPVAIDSTTMPLALDPELPDLDWATESLYARLADAGHAPVSAEYAVEARAADAEQAALLGTPAGSPVLVADSEVGDDLGRVIITGVITYRGDRYRFRSRLTAGAGLPVVQAARGR